MDIVVWLRSLGLGKYEAAFRDNEIDETVLPSLTHETLKELGVTAVGHRLKLLDAIAALRSDVSSKPLSVDATTTSSTPSAHPEDRAERRQVTVMFSDLVGSTALSARMDPEDLREVISAYQKCVAETVRRFDGFVAKYLGDGVLVRQDIIERTDGIPLFVEEMTKAVLEAGSEGALAAIPSMLPDDSRSRRKAFDLIKQVLRARGSYSQQDRERLQQIGRLFGVDEPLLEDDAAARQGKIRRVS